MRDVLLDKVEGVMKVINLHAKRLRYAIEKITPYMPMTDRKIEALSEEEIPVFELFSSRFAKLQDSMGSQLFDLVLELASEHKSAPAVLDKLHMLEKLNCIPDAGKWLELRQIRNHLAHEYPDRPEVMAAHFNDAFDKVFFLLECLDRFTLFIDEAIKKRQAFLQ